MRLDGIVNVTLSKGSYLREEERSRYGIEEEVVKRENEGVGAIRAHEERIE